VRRGRGRHCGARGAWFGFPAARSTRTLGVSVDEFSLRPVLSGIVGGLFAWWLTTKWSRWIPNRIGAKGADTLIAENRWRILGANALFFGALVVGIILFKNGYFARSDWQAFGLVVGLAFVAPVVFLYVSSFHLGSLRVQEVFVAYAISQRAPMIVLYGLVALGFVVLCVSIASLADA